MGNIPQASKLMQKASNLDPLNSVYLLSMAIYESKLGNKSLAQDYLQRTIDLNPSQQGIEIVRQMLVNK